MINQKTYKSGLRLVVETNDNPICSFTQKTIVGSSDETFEEEGLAHFTEHLMFKSTEKRTSLELNSDMERLGVLTNAYTTKRETVYYFVATEDNFTDALEIFSDMLQNGIYAESDVNTERGVVVQEINMYDDDSDAVLEDAIDSVYFSGTGYEHPVLGRRELIENTTIDALKAFKSKHYTPDKIILSIVSGLSFEAVEGLIKKYFPKYFEGERIPYDRPKDLMQITIKRPYFVVDKDDTQVRVNAMIKAVDVNDKYYLPQMLYSVILGGGMSSRLFTNIRDRLGLVYSIGSTARSYKQFAFLGVSLGTTKEHLNLALTEIDKEFNHLADNGITEDELIKAKNLVKNIRVFGNEKVSSKCLFNAKIMADEVTYPDYKDYKKAIDSVTVGQVNEYAKLINEQKDFTICAIGKDVTEDELKGFRGRF